MIYTRLRYLALFMLIGISLSSCNANPIITLDEYNPPYNVTAIPGDSSVRVRFVSGVLSTDFAGFNVYVNNFALFDDAILNTAGGRPTITGTNHTRQLFEINIPTYKFNNGTLYEIAITAYGTNELAENKRIETSISAKSKSKCIPRPETTEALRNSITLGGIAFTFTDTTISVSTGGIQYFGVQTKFNDITVVTNTSLWAQQTLDRANGGLYIAYDRSTTYVKVWISGNQITWAVNDRADLWNGV